MDQHYFRLKRNRQWDGQLLVYGQHRPGEKRDDDHRGSDLHPQSKLRLLVCDQSIESEFRCQRRSGKRDGDSRDGLHVDCNEQRCVDNDHSGSNGQRQRDSGIHGRLEFGSEPDRDFDHRRSDLHRDAKRGRRRMHLLDHSDEQGVHLDRRSGSSKHHCWRGVRVDISEQRELDHDHIGGERERQRADEVSGLGQ